MKHSSYLIPFQGSHTHTHTHTHRCVVECFTCKMNVTTNIVKNLNIINSLIN